MTLVSLITEIDRSNVEKFIDVDYANEFEGIIKENAEKRKQKLEEEPIPVEYAPNFDFQPIEIGQ